MMVTRYSVPNKIRAMGGLMQAQEEVRMVMASDYDALQQAHHAQLYHASYIFSHTQCSCHSTSNSCKRAPIAPYNTAKCTRDLQRRTCRLVHR